MRILLVSITCLFLIPFKLFSQGSTMNPNAAPGSEYGEVGKRGRVMIVPYEPRMYYSEFDKEFAKKDNLEFRQINEKFRRGLEFCTIAESEKQSYSAFSLNNINDEVKISDLESIYGSLKYSFTEYHANEKLKEDKGASMKAKKNSKEARDQTPIESGEIAIEPSQGERFMNSAITDDKLINYLHNKYGAEKYILINQIDLKNDLTGAYKADENGLSRILRVHYTILNESGLQIYAGVSAITFSNEMNEIEDLVKTKLPLIAEAMVSNLSSLIDYGVKKSKENPKPELEKK